jgi:diguanylate cyclase (GGDEF)-like protein
MTENVAILLAVLVAANVVLLLILLGRSWMQRRRSSHRAALDAISSTPVARASSGPRPTVTTGATTAGSAATGASLSFADGPTPSRSDPVTGALLPGEWHRLLADEDARIQRYERAATVVLVELDGLDGFVAALGQDAADRVLPAVADTLTRHGRAVDAVARLGPGRFGVLLPETGEVEAVNYVERIRGLCELWLESGAIAMRLAIGWASSAQDRTMADAYSEALERMYVELRRTARRSGGEPVEAAEPVERAESAVPADVVEVAAATEASPDEPSPRRKKSPSPSAA